MDLKQLRYFLAVERAGSMAGAGRDIHVSQPALGAKIAQLEEELGTALFERHSRGIRPTEAGRVLVVHAEEILARIEALRAALAPLAKRSPVKLAIGLNPTASRLFATDLLEALDLGGGVVLREGLSNEIHDAVSAGALDAGFCYDPPPGQLAVLELFTEALHLVGPPDALGSGGDIAFDQLGAYSLVLDGGVSVLRTLVEQTARARGVVLKVSHEVEPANVKRRLMLQRGHSTIVSYVLFAEEIGRGVLGARRIVKPRLRRRLCLVLRKGIDADVGRLLGERVTALTRQRLAMAGTTEWIEAGGASVDKAGAAEQSPTRARASGRGITRKRDRR